MYVDVWIDSLSPQQGVFTYQVPPDLYELARPGAAVLVPFGPRTAGGYVVKCHQEPPAQATRPVLSALANPLPPDLMTLLQWGALYYGCPFGSLLLSAVPKGTLAQVRRRIRLVQAPPEDPLTRDLVRLLERHPDGVSVTQFKRDQKPALQKLLQGGWVTSITELVESVTQEATTRQVQLLKIDDGLSRRQREVLTTLADLGGTCTWGHLLREARTTGRTLQQLVHRGYLSVKEASRQALSLDRDTAKTLTPEQAAALAKIREGGHSLLYGVTGSGKTEVYLQLIAECLEQGKGALVLVPEISLTPQAVARFRARFGDSVAVLHSGLSDGARAASWRRIRHGDCPVVVGTRSAIFAPFPQLGLIVLDEEHDSSYKQDTNPRYHAKTLAWKRAQLTGATLLLGSATPSLESFYASEKGTLQLVRLSQRVHGQPLPPVTIIDMRLEAQEGNRSLFSRTLLKAVEDRLAKGEQTLLFLNRRGWAPFLFCRSCGSAVQCPHCAVSLTVHQKERLICHYCDYQTRRPERCPQCRHPHLRPYGLGTQKVEEEIQKRFQARVLRLDRDTVSKRGAASEILSRFARGEADVLVGTQMVTKGLDIPTITLVGVLLADSTLNLPDFRSAERTFQLITQVAGRAGRDGSDSLVVVQTFNPEHYAIQTAQFHDYDRFVQAELQYREVLAYPPYASLIQVHVAALDEAQADQAAQSLHDQLVGTKGLHALLGPAPAPVAKIKDFHRRHLLLKGSPPLLVPQLLALKEQLPEHVRMAIDVDPQQLL